MTRFLSLVLAALLASVTVATAQECEDPPRAPPAPSTPTT